ncbi:PIN/TRAM domain-containing protein [Limosilactobacillus fastidiosus]|uniref:PIN/TRAM domain-containing protein n=1 Tax=Limosilactobacillus fastidiosus TaxID=2759855 RepID=A0A7W3YC63_9LACO|nr:PIN/TRAM domain-containing protein [Limosilactobacillus fastidiosus]MBB1062902.1 PIN/TRAM domain-containing protein [Limosilactobacillus fastidiosus]MBB1086429.1 PIN/TRAM domain-containing protein [Limosilactobacillus fastidiosus]MCD7083748.1 PIN/TRAM domain-containing protein [Limosilactobacillus fastidiosus]MCD7086308.1 PIN/TRAM domain-containing protein [Limosilactobacillus fastidiosus]MCD7114911.1 PIN/TRAM domain-containing protein [Limosilactobacillus fastidiosus]
MRKKIIRLIYIVVGAAIGFYYLPLFWDLVKVHLNNALLVFIDIILGAFIFFILSLLLAKPTEQLVVRIEKSLTKLSPVYLFFGTLLTIVGLVLAVLVSIPLWRTGIPVINNVLPILLMITFSYFGYRIGTTRLDDWKNLLSGHRVRPKNLNTEVIDQKDENYHHYKILDTNILIDGRIYDLVKTGFLEGTLLVPNFVLYELQYIADSGENIKRVRGRRGLDILNKLRKEKIVPIEMYDGDFEDIPEVDSKLIVLAKKVNGVIVTNDYNLNKVIQFQNVQVLNINNLAKSLRPRVIPGETLNVVVVKNGTERQQGVAYLDDGTMVVVEDGRYFMNKRIEVEVTSALQTDAGRMIFARPLHSRRGINEKNSESSKGEKKVTKSDKDSK